MWRESLNTTKAEYPFCFDLAVTARDESTHADSWVDTVRAYELMLMGRHIIQLPFSESIGATRFPNYSDATRAEKQGLLAHPKPQCHVRRTGRYTHDPENRARF
jgi:hypothetical protein